MSINGKKQLRLHHNISAKQMLEKNPKKVTMEVQLERSLSACNFLDNFH
jgi:hypothetical protein